MNIFTAPRTHMNINTAANLARKVPWKKVGAVAAGATGGALLAAPLMVAILGPIGFSSIGPVAGSAAAAAQGAFLGGAVPAGHIFAVCQSIAMGGAVPAVIPVVGSAIGVAAGAAGAAVAAVTRKGNRK